MKKLTLLICIALFGMLFACTDSEKKVLEDDLSTYLETVKLPDNFSVDIDIEKVTSRDTAKIYKARFLEFDKDKLADRLISGEIVNTKILAEGHWFEAFGSKGKEYLVVFDGGKSLGIDSGVEGGFIYSCHSNEYDKLSYIIQDAPGPPNKQAQIDKYPLKSNYSSFEDLSFMTYEDALSEVKKILDSIDFPEFEVSESYSLDSDTMAKNYELYLKNVDGRKDEYSFTKDNECYFFVLRQVIDGIPLANVYWHQGIRGPGEVTETKITLFYSKDGLIAMRASGIYEIIEEGEDEKLINSTKALDIVIDNYSNAVLKSPTRITSMELNYVGVISKNNYKLIPAWVFCIAEEREDEEFKTLYDLYDYFVINAITGERILNAR